MSGGRLFAYFMVVFCAICATLDLRQAITSESPSLTVVYVFLAGLMLACIVVNLRTARLAKELEDK